MMRNIPINLGDVFRHLDGVLGYYDMYEIELTEDLYISKIEEYENKLELGNKFVLYRIWEDELNDFDINKLK